MALLEIDSISSFYGDFQALFDVSVAVEEGETVAIIGANGAGKTTLLSGVAGVVQPRVGEVRFDGVPIGGLAPERIVARGVVHVAEGRRVFPGLSVTENLCLGAYRRRLEKGDLAADLERVYQLFPRLAERAAQPAGRLSGGEQQMLVIARALLARPRLLMVDEPSVGLAPNVVESLFEALKELHGGGLTVLLVEQYVALALKLAGRGYVLRRGKVALAGTSAQLGQAGVVEASYLGDESARPEPAHGGNR
jgi:branched-chain amino acid transport system ATP-binding protein